MLAPVQFVIFLPTSEAVKTEANKKLATSQTSQLSFPSSIRGGSGFSALGRIRNRHPGSMTTTLAMQLLAWHGKCDVPEAARATQFSHVLRQPTHHHSLAVLLQIQWRELHTRQCRSRTRMGRAASWWNLQRWPQSKGLNFAVRG